MMISIRKGALKFSSALLLLMMSFSLSNLFVPQKVQADDEKLFEVGGRVLDTQRSPLVGAQVRLLDHKGNVLDSASSGKNGVFSLKHPECDSCSLNVVPGEKTAFSSALIEEIPGNIDRKFIVTLQQGFKVTGKVTGAGKGLKGLVVRVTATNTDPGHVHAGGLARTSRGGTFEMNLTPGPKQLVVRNDKYSEFVDYYESKLSVTADREIPVIELPAPKQD